MSVFYAYRAGFDAANLPGRRSEQEDVACQTLDREIFVERPDKMAVGLGDDAIVRDLGNRTAAGNRGQPRPATRAQHTVDAIVVQKRATAAARRSDAVREHRDDFVKIF